MSEFVSPAAGPIALPAKAAPPSVLAPGVPSLAAFIDLMIGKIAPPVPKAATGKGERQGDADSGKELPDGRKPTIDPTLAWLFAAPPIPTPQRITVALPQTAAELAALVGLDLPAPLPVKEGLGVGAERSEALTPVSSVAADAVASAPTPNPSLPGRGIADLAPVLGEAQPNVLLVAPPATVALPAMFALRRAPDRDDEAPSSPTAATVTLSQPATSPIAPTGDAQRQTLDLGARDWPQKMIDHIEALRDNADANDTSIHLKPEALGRVDVSLRTHTDGAISVRFTADQPTTRTLLADAAPQLTAAADARGIRLSGTSVDLSGQGDQRPRPDVERQQNTSNHRAAPRGDDNQAVDDGRIA